MRMCFHRQLTRQQEMEQVAKEGERERDSMILFSIIPASLLLYLDKITQYLVFIL